MRGERRWRGLSKPREGPTAVAVAAAVAAAAAVVVVVVAAAAAVVLVVVVVAAPDGTAGPVGVAGAVMEETGRGSWLGSRLDRGHRCSPCAAR